ncbi:MAG: hypothetical protein OEN22_04780 [Gammaproteobacteria bacterium]|nr:hypothetical protein [Gammaproteobacteria bacterium]
MSTWPADIDLGQRFSHPANAGILGFLEAKYPFSAHGDLAEELLVLAKEIPEAHSYCPDNANFAYWFLYANSGVIFAFAIDMWKLSFRLPGCATDALADGGVCQEEFGSDWFAFEAFGGRRDERRIRSSYWLKKAFTLANEAGSS